MRGFKAPGLEDNLVRLDGPPRGGVLVRLVHHQEAGLQQERAEGAHASREHLGPSQIEWQHNLLMCIYIYIERERDIM